MSDCTVLSFRACILSARQFEMSFSNFSCGSPFFHFVELKKSLHWAVDLRLLFLWDETSLLTIMPICLYYMMIKCQVYTIMSFYSDISRNLNLLYSFRSRPHIRGLIDISLINYVLLFHCIRFFFFCILAIQMKLLLGIRAPKVTIEY